jgi:hypothetical protein
LSLFSIVISNLLLPPISSSSSFIVSYRREESNYTYLCHASWGMGMGVFSNKKDISRCNSLTYNICLVRALEIV